MAKLTVPTDYNGKEKIQLYEPACGAGGNMLATAFVLQERNINYQRCLRVMGVFKKLNQSRINME